MADNIKETQKLTAAATDLVERARAEAARIAAPPSPPVEMAPQPVIEVPAPSREVPPASPQPSLRGLFSRVLSDLGASESNQTGAGKQ
jgi:hypothetical protein